MKAHQNPLSHLGWLGIVGLVGLWHGPWSLLVFLLFFFFFRYRRVVPDELFLQNVRRAGLRAFAANTAAVCLLLLYLAVWSTWLYAAGAYRTAEEAAVLFHYDALLTAFALIFGLSVAVFLLSLLCFERRERRCAGC